MRAAFPRRPSRETSVSVARAFSRSFGLGHFLAHFGFDRVEVEACSSLHRRVIEEGLDFLAHDLLDENEAPELVFEPVEVLLAAFLGSTVRPTGTLKGIETQVGDVRHIRMGLFTYPALRLIDE